MLIHTSPGPCTSLTRRRSRPRARATVGAENLTASAPAPAARLESERASPAEHSGRAATSASAQWSVLTPGSGMQLAQAGRHSGDCLFRRRSYLELFARGRGESESESVTAPARGSLVSAQTATLSLLPARRPRPARPPAIVLAGYKSCRRWRCQGGKGCLVLVS